MTGPTHPDGGDQLDQTEAQPVSVDPPPVSPAASAASGRPAWLLFFGVASAVVIIDLVSKAWVVANIVPGTARPLLTDLVRLIHSRNDGAIFGLFGTTAPILALASIGVLALIVGYHARSGRSPLLSVALGLLLGGALGNLFDRIRFGYVVDWVDMGLGNVRFWTFNLGDAAISLAILLLLSIALWPGLAGQSTKPGARSTDSGGSSTDG